MSVATGILVSYRLPDSVKISHNSISHSHGDVSNTAKDANHEGAKTQDPMMGGRYTAAESILDYLMQKTWVFLALLCLNMRAQLQ